MSVLPVLLCGKHIPFGVVIVEGAGGGRFVVWNVPEVEVLFPHAFDVVT